VEDLLVYDAIKSANGRRNVLADDAPQLAESNGPPLKRVAAGSCKHAYLTKPDQCCLPLHGSKPSVFSTHSIAAFCSFCRYHVKIVLDYTGDSMGATPCPGDGYPLHHFRYSSRLSQPGPKVEKPDRRKRWVDRRVFKCSAPSCPAVLTVDCIPPRLSDDDVYLLTDKAKIQARVDKAKASEPERSSFPNPDVFKVLQDLSTYISDAVHDTRPVNARNKHFRTSLGDDCGDLLEYLGFQYDVIIPHSLSVVLM